MDDGLNFIPHYPKVWRLGSPQASHIWGKTCTIQEKYDGSQLSWMYVDNRLLARSKRMPIDIDNPPDIFAPSIAHLKAVIAQKAQPFIKGAIYRGEAFKSNKHNTLRYTRTPRGNIVLYDVEVEDRFLPYEELEFEADALGVEPASIIKDEFIMTRDERSLNELLAHESSLGGPMVEGFVAKTGTELICKYVSPKFKEYHKNNIDWKKGKDLITAVAERFKTEARWEKAVNTLREEGRYRGEVQDIGPCIEILNRDFDDEIALEAKELLWIHARKQMIKHMSRGFAEWFKQRTLQGE